MHNRNGKIFPLIGLHTCSVPFIQHSVPLNASSFLDDPASTLAIRVLLSIFPAQRSVVHTPLKNASHNPVALHISNSRFQPAFSWTKSPKLASRTPPINLYTLDDELPPPAPLFNVASSSLPQEHAHPPYIPPFHVVGLAPYPVEMNGGEEGRRAVCDSQWNCDLKHPTKRLKEQNFFENNSQLSSADFLQARAVSTGLGLSLDNTSRAGSSGDSYFLSMLGDEIDRELQMQDAEIDRYLKVQGERLRKVILDKLQADQLQTISYVEDEVLQKLREKELEMQNMNRKNIELEERLEQLAMEVGAWQNQTKYTENMITLLRMNLQQVYAQSRDSKEGCGDSEVDDTASCYNGQAIDFHLLSKDNNNSDKKNSLTCKVCRLKEACMVLIPCKHLCLCKDCESRIAVCPLCHCSKNHSLEAHI
ncbi:uncharacterized protein [Phyllobates terribilis]|uniref:uncharacterized protein n=1 Tax=Phyllobates terribilis TaxID=111132 RepID=UPI003CCA9F1F